MCYGCGLDDRDDELFICDRCDYKICHWNCDRESWTKERPPERHENFYCKFCLIKHPDLYKRHEEKIKKNKLRLERVTQTLVENS